MQIAKMKAGTPVVTLSSTDMPEVAGDAAVIVDPYDVSQMASAISQLLRDILLREELIKKGKARARDYSGRHRGASFDREALDRKAQSTKKNENVK